MKKFSVYAVALALLGNLTFIAHANALATSGPGNRIHGLDISKWQHAAGKPINFEKMAKAGISFVMIKGGDGHDPSDATAFKYLKLDRPAAQAAGIYTGFYYYAYLPDSTNQSFIIADAKAQALKAVWRLVAIGGYSEMDLPIALDIENNCVRPKANGGCAKYMNRNLISLWTQTWLDTVKARTTKKPFVYSYAQFLQTAMVRSKTLASYPLWIANYVKTPATSQPGRKTVGCFAHAWTKGNCTTQWQIWQYSSCGIGPKYGIPSSRVDLNVFSGTEESFFNLVKGTWEPDLSDFLPENETTTITLVSSTSATTNDVTQFVVDVARPDGTPVVTGEVALKNSDTSTLLGVQKLVRSATGRWTLNITKLPAATYQAIIEFSDPTGTHALSQLPVLFTITQGPTPTPSPSPTKKPAPKPQPVDSCANQIRN
jgi:GH25 family lysozyme M1 (1,4-beta-N-acetylmuramidase)